MTHLRDIAWTAVLVIMKLSLLVGPYKDCNIPYTLATYHKDKGASNNRLAYLLRPNVTPDGKASATIDTPPVIDYSSNADINDNFHLDFVSKCELESDELDDSTFALPAIKKASLPVSPVLSAGGDAWSLVDKGTDDNSQLEVDDFMFESGSKFERADSIFYSVQEWIFP